MKMTTQKSRRGATLVEFAMVLPMLMLIVLGIMEFGWYTRTQLAVANAVREGARVASMGKTQGEIRTRVINTAAPIAVTSANITLAQSSNSGASYGAFPADDNAKIPPQNGVAATSLVRITVSIPYRRLVNLPVSPSQITVQVSMVRERT